MSTLAFPVPLWLSSSSLPPINQSLTANSPLVLWPARVVNQALSSPYYPAVPSPPLSARPPQMSVPQSLTSLAPLLRFAGLWASLTSTCSLSWGSLVGRCSLTTVFCSSEEKIFNTRNLSTAELLPHQKSGWRERSMLFLVSPLHPTIVSTHHY